MSLDRDRDEWRAIAEATTLHLIPQEALIATIKYLAQQLLELTEQARQD